MEKTEKPKVEKPGMEEKKGRRGSGHTAEEKCRAVLSVWTERRKPGEVCRELGVAWTVLNQWQERAMEGMLVALAASGPRWRKTVALNSRLAVLLERKSKGGTMKGVGAAFGPTPGDAGGQARGAAGRLQQRRRSDDLQGDWGWRRSGGRHKKEKEQELARERALVILQVRSGALTAKQGAKLLGVSRKTYYEWEEKSLKAMALALENRPAGRPPVLYGRGEGDPSGADPGAGEEAGSG